MVRTLHLDAKLPADIARAAEILRSGGIVALPTETVYGLGANALDPLAVARIFEAKQRPAWDPLIVHVCDLEMLPTVASGPQPLAGESRGDFHKRASRVMETGSALIDRFWPGPLTLLLPRTQAVPDAVTAGRQLIGVRMPRHLVAMAVIDAAGVPIAAPSANRFGHTSPTTAQHVLDDLDGRIDAVLDAGPCGIGVESTVLDINQSPMVVYRPGGVSVAMIEEVCGTGSVALYQAPAAMREPESLPSPGVGIRHYAPRAQLVLVDLRQQTSPRLQASLAPVVAACDPTELIGVMLPAGWDAGTAAVYNWGEWTDQETLAARLFAGLRALDEAGVGVIVCPVPEGAGIAVAIRDRLEKAARTG